MSVQSIFSNLASRPSGETRTNRVVAGFTQVFGAILSQQLRGKSLDGSEGPLGTAGGTTGDVYGAFFDEAMGHALATSPAMKPLNQAIERELERPLHSSGGTHTTFHLSETKSDQRAVAGSIPDMLQRPTLAGNSTDLDLSSDTHGPLLLPPEPAGVASLLPPPPHLEG
jgi:hypothetical protein